MSAQIQIEGLRELGALFRKLGDSQLPKELQKVNKDAAEIVTKEAEQRAPRRTGRLKKSIRATARQRDATVKAGNARVDYAVFVEFRNQQPFMYPARDAMEGRVVDEYEKALIALLRRIT